jgi:hypothetical protein
VTSQYNRIFARDHKLEYENFLGIKRGVHPHHAMFNRIHMLKELVDDDFRGWVIYVDADAIIIDREFPIGEYLSDLRASGKVMALHSVGDANWWNVNDGCFAIDLRTGQARSLVRAWAGIYTDLYSLGDYLSATDWASIIDDQTSLHLVLQQFKMRDYIAVTDLQGAHGFVRQALRRQSNVSSTDLELSERREALMKLGQSIYGASALEVDPGFRTSQLI